MMLFRVMNIELVEEHLLDAMHHCMLALLMSTGKGGTDL